MDFRAVTPNHDTVEKTQPEVEGRLSAEDKTQIMDADDGEIFHNVPGQTDFRALGW